MILGVPFYSQVKDTKNPDWKNKSCGITCVKMVIDYYHKSNLLIDDLYQKGLDLGGYKEDIGWYHHSLAILAKSLGYPAITRKWKASEEDLQKLFGRGFADSDINILNQQLENEALFTFKNEVEHGSPVIISVPNGFSSNGSGHLVVLVGFDEDNFYFNDPYKEKDEQPVKVSYKEFLNTFTGRAIIIHHSV